MHIPTKEDIGFAPKPRGTYKKRAEKPYVPTKKALAVCEFFRRNPDEMLTGPDVSAKFDIANHTTTLHLAVRAGMIAKTVPRRGMETVYTAGTTNVTMRRDQQHAQD